MTPPILVVDDDLGDLTLIGEAFRECEVPNPLIGVQTADEALRTLHGQAPCKPIIILLDLNLPGIDGHELLRKIRADERTSNAPVVIFSGSNSRDDINRAYAERANAYVVKPRSYAGLVEIVEAIRRIWISEAGARSPV